MALLALMAMVCASLAQHLGLTEAVTRILLRIARCPKCCSFWLSLAILTMCGCDLIIAIMLSLAVAYLSHWFGIVLYLLNDIYNKLWERVQRK